MKESREEVCKLRIQLVNGTQAFDKNLEFDCGVDNDPNPRYPWYSSSRKYRSGEQKTKTLTIPEDLSTDQQWTLVATMVQREEEATSVFDSFEGRIYAINVENLKESKDTGMVRCEACPFGQRQPPGIGRGQTCEECLAGTQANMDNRAICQKCPDGQFRQESLVNNEDDINSQCNPCGNHTVSNAARTGCEWESGEEQKCKFTGDDGNAYDLTKLGADGGEMVFGGHDGTFSYYLNPCYQTSRLCTENCGSKCVDAKNMTMPWQACQSEKGKPPKSDADDDDADGIDDDTAPAPFIAPKNINLGDTIGYDDLETGHVLMTFDDFGSRCRYRSYSYGQSGYATTHRHVNVHLICKNVGAGKPTSRSWKVERKTCLYEWNWETIYACPVCRPTDWERVQGSCDKTGQREVRFFQGPQLCQGEVPASTKEKCQYVALPTSQSYIAPLIFKMACKQNLDLRCVLAPAP